MIINLKLRKADETVKNNLSLTITWCTFWLVHNWKNEQSIDYIQKFDTFQNFDYSLLNLNDMFFSINK